MKWYEGIRRGDCGDVAVSVVMDDSVIVKRVPLKLYTEIQNHSPTGFEWGYGGSGPAQLALAILCDFTRDAELASELHQSFKADFIATLPKDEWRISEKEIKVWLDEQAAARETNDRDNNEPCEPTSRCANSVDGTSDKV
jgi:hypothetical protein